MQVVIRRLPPTMTEEEFAKQIDPIPDHDYFYFVPADWSLGVNATCRAYINFCNHDDIFIFRDKFDGYVFVDNKGSEYPAIVEFAPFQGLPKGKSRKKDLKSNTIETEPHFLAFLESLKDEEAEGKNELKMEYSFQLRDGTYQLDSLSIIFCKSLICLLGNRSKDYLNSAVGIFGKRTARAKGWTEAKNWGSKTATRRRKTKKKESIGQIDAKNHWRGCKSKCPNTFIKHITCTF